MIGILARLLGLTRKEASGQGKEEGLRKSYGMLCGVVGICLNILLFAGKFIAGTISKSVSITADALNNLSDAGSSFVTMVGFHLAGTKPDPHHPFGHGRMEYVSGLVVSGAILIMAFELVKSSIDKIRHPGGAQYGTLALIILAVSIAVKLYMYLYNRSYGKKLASAAMQATAADSLSDACATTVVLIAAIVERIFTVHIDGWCGLLVGLFIFYAGIRAAKETLDPLLGQPPEPEFVAELENLVMQHEEVRGVHDLIVHDYGPGRRIVSLHAEVPAESDILLMHDAIDNIEAELRERLHCDAVIHMDPVVTTDETVLALKKKLQEIVLAVGQTLSLHDFRVVTGPTHTNLIFDVVIPYDFPESDEEVLERIRTQTREQLGETYHCVIQVDKSYVR